MLKKLSSIIPKYAVIPLLITIVANMIAYYGSTLFVESLGLTRHSVALPLDEKIPFAPEWIVIYMGCYISWVAFYIITCRESKEVCYNFVVAEAIAKMLALIIFVSYPTIMLERAEFQASLGDGIFEKITAYMFNSDKPYNLFPSIHCLASWIGFRGLLWCKKVGKPLKIFAFVLAILVFLSTLFVKQHYLIDIFGGVLVVEIGIFISKRLRLASFIRRKICNEQI